MQHGKVLSVQRSGSTFTHHHPDLQFSQVRLSHELRYSVTVHWGNKTTSRSLISDLRLVNYFLTISQELRIYITSEKKIGKSYEALADNMEETTWHTSKSLN